MNVLDLFSGIGGFSLGLERAGMRTVAFCEIDGYCRAVLRRHWPDVPIFDDVRTLTATSLGVAKGNGCGARRSGRSDPTSAGQQQPDQSLQVDLICGGFPCQDISIAGKGAGIEGGRSGLWSEYARIIGEVRPRYVIVENVAALLGRGLERVLGDLAALGFDAEWHCIPACAVGAPHKRDRIWIVAYASGSQWRSFNSSLRRCERDDRLPQGQESPSGLAAGSQAMANAGCQLLERWFRQSAQGSAQWLVEPDVGRVAHGVPARVDRLRALGNAVVPQIPEIIGRAIMSLVNEGERLSATTGRE